MTTNAYLRPTRPDEALLRLQQLLRVCSDGVVILKQESWVAAPVESGSHFSDQDVAGILAVAEANGDRSVTLVELGSPDGRVPRWFECDVGTGAFDEINRELGLFDILVLPPSGSWAVLAGEADFLVVMGTPANVELLTGESAEAAAEAFAQSLDLWTSGPPSHLRMLADFPWHQYDELPTGVGLFFPVFRKAGDVGAVESTAD